MKNYILNINHHMLTMKDAGKKKCPYILNKQGYPKNCDPECMSWIEAYGETSREDHSGGDFMILEMARSHGVEAIRSGPSGSMGKWTVPAVGFCLRLWKGISNE